MESVAALRLSMYEHEMHTLFPPDSTAVFNKQQTPSWQKIKYLITLKTTLHHLSVGILLLPLLCSPFLVHI